MKTKYNEYSTGQIAKADYIRGNYEETYSKLFDLADFISGTDISKIEILDNQVVMTYRRSGIKLACEKKEYRTAPLETLNFLQYEENEVGVFSLLLEGKKSFYDIGGNIGFYAIHAAKLNPGLVVHSFEPIPKMYESLCSNVQLNGLQERIYAHNFGFSDKEGSVSFYLYPFGGVNASMQNVSETASAVEVTSRVLRLDDFSGAQAPMPDIIKCDVEGAEKLVLDGGLETIRQARPVILFELLRKWSAKFGYHPNEVLGKLKELGYGCYVPQFGALHEFDKMDDETKETNFFFLHKEKHEKEILRLVKRRGG